ncbi:helix-turn-helix domain-containing protein [Methylobacterium platani]
MAHEAMRAALAAHGGNVSRAARSLGISRSTLYRRCLAEA